MASFVQPDRSEARLQALANLIAEVRLVESNLTDSGSIGEDAPFLSRQLHEAVRSLRTTAASFLGEDEDKKESRGFLGRLFKSGQKDDPTPPPRDRGVEGFQGNASTIPVPELIGFLANTRKTGVLWVYAAKETFMIEFKEGALLHATTDRPPSGQRLGEVLVESGAITEREIDRFLNTDPSPGMLGSKLLRAFLITDETLLGALSTQVQHLFCRLLAETNAIFLFKQGVSLAIDQPLSINVTHLLLESARMSDERGYAELRSSFGDGADEAVDEAMDAVLDDGEIEAVEDEAGGDEKAEEDESADEPLKKSA